MALEDLKPKLNKSAKEGYTYRSPDQTNAKSYLPHPKEDVMASQSADNARIKKGLDAPAERAYNRLQQQEAGGRAITRSAGRAGAAGVALEGGYELGKYIDEKTGAGKKLVEKSGLGALAEKMATPKDKVELTEESKARIAKGDLDAKPSKPSFKSKTRVEADTPEGSVRSGSNENISDDVRQRAMSYANSNNEESSYKKGGMTASSRADGIAQRGKTRGKVC
jgi:hypothetical protein